MKIGISISGGGYRATTYSLSTFSYLNHLQLNDQPLLQSVEALSSISWGSITGITYALSVKRGQSFDDYFTTIYNFITEYVLISDAIKNFVQTNTKPSLIEGIATSYANQLFKDLRPDTDETFRTNPRFDAITPALKNDSSSEYDSHQKFVCINAANFNTGTPFRFIAKYPSVKEEFLFGISFHIVSKEIEKIPLNIAMAASSCFSGGFEPIVFDLKNRVNNIEEKVTKDFQFEVLNNPQKYKE